MTAVLEAASFRPAVLAVAVAFTLLAIFGRRANRWVRRRWFTAHPTIEQASHDRAEVVANPTLSELANAGRGYAVVSEITRDPDPEPRHPYMRDRQSGAGNCICGAAERHRRHPHQFMPAMNSPQHCVCALPREAKCHQASHDRTDKT